MKRDRMKRLLWIALAAVIAFGIGAPYLNADFILPRIERALERGLGRRVDIARGVNFNLFTGPGFTLNDVTIYEDPRAGIEPFAHVWTLEARVRLLSLFSRKLEFSSLRLGEQTDINLVKTEAGPWNFQFLLGSAPALAGSMPAIRMRGGRVNFKFGDTKSVFYLSDADFDVSPSDEGSVELRLSGAPSRTDQAAQNFGHFFLRGTWNRQRLDMRVELEPSALEEVARLFDQRGFGLHGIIALDAQISGAPSNLGVAGYLQIDDLHRGDLPKRSGTWRVDYKGSLDLRGDRLELESTADAPNPPLALRFRAWDFLSAPQWDAAADLKRIPLSMVMEAARHVGAALSDKLAAEGSVSGEVRYGKPDGLAGHVELQDATLTLPDAQPLHAASAEVAIDGDTMSLATSTVRVGDNGAAEVEGSFNPAQGLDLKIATRGLSVADLRSFGLSAIPLLEQTPLGTWRGWARYQWTPGAAGEWSGEYDLQNAHIAIEGLADLLRIQSASVISSGARVSVSRLRAKIGAIASDRRLSLGAVGRATAQIPHRDPAGRCRGAGADSLADTDSRAGISGAHPAPRPRAGSGMAETTARGRDHLDRHAGDRRGRGEHRRRKSAVGRHAAQAGPAEREHRRCLGRREPRARSHGPRAALSLRREDRERRV